MPRPFINATSPQLRYIANNYWDNAIALQFILSELLYRSSRGAKRLREEIIDRLVILSCNEYFVWPTTEAPEGLLPINGNIEWHPQGVLSYLGYKVGENGAEENTRHSILTSIYCNNLPNLISQEYMLTWGAPNSAIRLKKMANSIAAFTRNARRNNPIVFIVAIDEWEADLLFLKYTYYIGKYDNLFIWPLANI